MFIYAGLLSGKEQDGDKQRINRSPGWFQPGGITKGLVNQVFKAKKNPPARGG